MRVLIVDDSATFTSAARKMLEHRGYTIVGEANSAASALDLIERVEPEALLVDVDLPDVSGFDLAPLALAERPGLAILLTSADLNTNYFGLARRVGARGFVPKLMLPQVDLARFWGPRTGQSRWPDED